MTNSKNNDEIDLMEFFLKAINILRANFWLIVIFFVLGSGLGLGYFYSSKSVFESNMIISSDILTESNSKILFEATNKHRKQRNLATISAQFKMDEKEVQEISSISIQKLSETELKESDRFLITASVFDQKILPKLQDGIVLLMEENEFVQKRVELKKRYIRTTLGDVEREVKDLTEFKTRISKGDFFENAKGNVMFDPTTVNSKILELNERRAKLQNELELANSVQVIVGFSIFAEQTSPRMSVSLVAGSSVGLFFVAALIAFKSVRKLLAMAENTQ